MQVPLEIAFHNLDPQPRAEREIRAKVAKLEKLHDRITGVRVRVDQRINKSPNSLPPVVRIEISLPGKNDIIVSHEPEHLLQRYQHPDLHNAIVEAFRIAERQLLDRKQELIMRSAEPPHESDQLFRGEVAELEDDHGFITTKEGSLLYFHRNSLLAGDFDKLKLGDVVHYVERDGDTGPTAGKVWVKDSAKGAA